MKIERGVRWGVGLLFLIVSCVLFSLYEPLQNGGVLNNESNSVADQIGGDFTLTDQNGLERSTSEFRGKYILIYFGYTSCDSICYGMLENISYALKILGDDLDVIVPIFVTINPERDTVSQLKNYAKEFHHKFIMMTGTPEQVSAILNQYKVYYLKIKSDESMADYLIEHSNLIYLLDKKDGRLIHFFDSVTSPENLAKQIKVYLDKF